ncbi:MAG: hypothetical protein J7L11_05755 [Thermoprotei archaeon]|nr:hypothetical protein [Thermoprotei archaeon]
MAIAILHDAGVVTADRDLREIAEVCEIGTPVYYFEVMKGGRGASPRKRSGSMYRWDRQTTMYEKCNSMINGNPRLGVWCKFANDR